MYSFLKKKKKKHKISANYKGMAEKEVGMGPGLGSLQSVTNRE